MAEAKRDEVPAGAGWTPVPDPTVLTSTMIDKARDDIRREMDFRLQILSQRLDSMDAATILMQDWRETLPRRLEEAMLAYQNVVAERFNVVNERFQAVTIQFTNIQAQFAERDTRSDMMAQSGEKNIASALAAAKELVSAQNIASANAIDKNGRDTDKRIDTTVQLLQSTTAALDERIAALTEQAKTSMTRQEVEQLFRTVMDKLDGPTGIAMRLESVIARGIGTTTEQGRNTQQSQWVIGAIIGAIALLIAMAAFVVNITKGGL